MANPSPVLITGGAGYIGGHVLLALAEAGRQAIVLDDLSTGDPVRVVEPHILIEGDIGDRGLVSRLVHEHQIKTVVHLAGLIDAPGSVADPMAYYDVNAGRTVTLLGASMAAGAQAVLFSSSATVYGNRPEPVLTEGLPCAPISPYGQSKLMVEQMLADLSAAHGMRFATLRYFNVAGADPQGRCGPTIKTQGQRHLIDILCEVVEGARPHVDVFGTDYPTPDGTCLRDYIHVSDLATAHRLTLDLLEAGQSPGLINCGYGHGVSVHEMIAAMRSVTGHAIPSRQTARRPGDPASLIADASHLRALTGWTPKHDDLTDILTSVVGWRAPLI